MTHPQVICSRNHVASIEAAISQIEKVITLKRRYRMEVGCEETHVGALRRAHGLLEAELKTLEARYSEA